MSSSAYTQMNPELAARLTKEIGGITEGIVLQEAAPGSTGRRFQARVYDKASHKYTSASFNRTQDLVAFVRETWTNFEKGVARAGAVTLDAELPGWIAALRARCNCEQHVNEIERILKAAREFGVNDLKSDNVARKASDFLAQYRPKVGFGMRTKPHSDATTLRYVAHFRAFGRYLCQPTLTCPRAKLLVNPFLALERPQLDTVMMNILSMDEAEAVASDMALVRNDGVYFALRLYTGLRRREAAWLRWEHIGWDGKLIAVKLPDQMDADEATRLKLTRYTEKRVKGSKERFAILSDELAEILMKIRPFHGRGYVFRDTIRSRSTHNEVKSFRYHLKTLGIVRPELTPHDLRSTNACLWLHAGLNTLQLVNHLGHADADMTNHYAGRANEYRAHPRAQGWAGEIRLRRTGCNTGSTPTTTTGRIGSGEIKPEDDIDDCIIAIIPDKLAFLAK